MHPDVAKLVESGRIPEAVGKRISQLAPGRFCLHKSWGSGKVTDWDLFGGKVTIDFERESARVMGLKLALDKTEPIEADDFRAQKIEQIEPRRVRHSLSNAILGPDGPWGVGGKNQTSQKTECSLS